MYALDLFIRDVFRGSNNKTVPEAYATQASNGLLERLLQFAETTKTLKWQFKVSIRIHFELTVYTSRSNSNQKLIRSKLIRQSTLIRNRINFYSGLKVVSKQQTEANSNEILFLD